MAWYVDKMEFRESGFSDNNYNYRFIKGSLHIIFIGSTYC